ncbi:acetyl-CoA synthetase-like protein [Coccomyxa subellipsoidea C-169]|uniref:Acetyl-CoA synthetase-like protein n=1 Tax=Coccomyxa subellipsoidea (strain C-169) TaxID=574566 RepID=I0Z359_COCSC|nr:acetyl-CoA synthetase-like protein [Coccomyxa subellipsoidea C-169]EIE25078.1 acetyl-CoA synthetase-like protein [Coccomyxa subellipsoidea C-169]|eukprot:XP_005649622.1 acetyl-CoA synthetase-like protein [Coccomyxa subellipsoidea C-169]
MQVTELSGLICQTLGAATAASDGGQPPIVGLYLDTSIAYVIGVLATLRARAAFMPLDARWPPSKLTAVLDDARPAVILWADKACNGCGPVAHDRCPLLQIPSTLLDPANPADIREGQTAGAEVGTHLQENGMSEQADAPSIAYVMHTSGSTGIVNRFRWMQRAHPFKAGDVACFHTAPTFVDSIWQIFGPLLGGVPLLVLPPSASHDLSALFKALQQQNVTHFVSVPTVLAALLRYMDFTGQQAPPSLRLLVSSGEPLPAQLLRRLQAFLPPHAVILNLYGSTETAADCTCCDATAWLRRNASAAPGAATPSVTLLSVQLCTAEDQSHGNLAISSAKGGPPALQSSFKSAGDALVHEPDPAGLQADSVTADRGEDGRERIGEEQSSVGDAGISTETVPVGWPLDNMAVFIAAPVGDGGGHSSEEGAVTSMSASEVLDLGEEGEVCVVGDGLSAGYLRQPEQTRRRFASMQTEQLRAASAEILWGEETSEESCSAVANSQPSSQKIFRTGDLGLITPHGLEIRGRLDLQVKIGGVRIDSLEVEACLAAHPGVVAAAATVWPAGPLNGMRLCAYVELNTSSTETYSELKSWCMDYLPTAAVPSIIVVLPALPRSSAGKIQRGDLPRPAGLAQCIDGPPSIAAAQLGGISHPEDGAQAALPHGFPFAGPGGLEAAAMRAFSAALGLPSRALEPGTDFWSAGGDSLSAAQVAGWLGVDVRMLTAFPTARTLAAQLRAMRATNSTPNLDSQEKPSRAAAPSSAALESRPLQDALHEQLRKRRRVSAREPDQAPGRADWTLTPPSPALGGMVLQRGGHVSVWPRSGVFSAAATLASSAQFPLQLPQLAGSASEESGAPAHRSHTAAGVSTEDEGDRVAKKRGQATQHASGLGQGDDVMEGQERGVLWRVEMKECVDASPVILVQAALEQAGKHSGWEREGSRQLREQQLRWFVLGCSHGGDVVCIDGPSGTPLWRSTIGGRAESGLTLTGDLQHVAVAQSEGRLCFLRTADGVEVGSCETGGALRAAPVTDPWLGYIWAASHGRQLNICRAPGEVILRQDVGSAVSASVAFHAASRRAYLCALDGTLSAWDFSLGPQADQEAGRGSEVGILLAWSAQLGSPVFAAPAVTVETASVIAATAKGHVMAFSAAGQLLWKTDIGSAVFASPCLIGGIETGGQILVGCQQGTLHCLKSSDGAVEWVQPIGTGGISTAATPILSAKDRYGKKRF